MAQSTFGSDLFVQGSLACTSFTPPNSCITKSAVVANAQLEASKLEHRYCRSLTQVSGSAVVASTYPLHICRAAGTVIAVEALVFGVVPTGADTITIDVHKSTGGGAFSTILSGTIVLDVASVIRVPEVATISSSTLVDNDILELVITVSGTSGQGLLVNLWLNEMPQ
jgi:hypothetical protein